MHCTMMGNSVNWMDRALESKLVSVLIIADYHSYSQIYGHMTIMSCSTFQCVEKIFAAIGTCIQAEIN